MGRLGRPFCFISLGLLRFLIALDFFRLRPYAFLEWYGMWYERWPLLAS